MSRFFAHLYTKMQELSLPPWKISGSKHFTLAIKTVVHKLAQYRKSNDVAMSLYSVICVLHTFTSHSSIIRVITATRHKQNWGTCAGQQPVLTTRASHIIQHNSSCPLTKLGIKQCHTSWRRG